MASTVHNFKQEIGAPFGAPRSYLKDKIKNTERLTINKPYMSLRKLVKDNPLCSIGNLTIVGNAKSKIGVVNGASMDSVAVTNFGSNLVTTYSMLKSQGKYLFKIEPNKVKTAIEQHTLPMIGDHMNCEDYLKEKGVEVVRIEADLTQTKPDKCFEKFLNAVMKKYTCSLLNMMKNAAVKAAPTQLHVIRANGHYVFSEDGDMTTWKFLKCDYCGMPNACCMEEDEWTMNCANCGSDLTYCRQEVLNVPLEETEENDDPPNIGTLLDQLLKKKYTDGISLIDKSNPSWPQMVRHDLGILKQAFSRVNAAIVTIPDKLDKVITKKILEVVKNVELVNVDVPVTPHAVFQLQIDVMVEPMLSSGYCGSIEGCGHLDVDNGTKNGKWIGPYKFLDMENLINEINAQRLRQLTVLTPTNSIRWNASYGQLKSEIGVWHSKETELYITLNNTNQSIVLDRKLAENLELCDFINYNGIILQIVKEKTLLDMSLLRIKKIATTEELYNSYIVAKWLPEHKVEMKIPILNATNVLDHTGIPLIQIKNVELNAELLRQLCIRNLTGELEYNTMLEYGVALSHSRFAAGDHISRYMFDATQIKEHVIASMIMSKRCLNKYTGGLSLMTDNVPNLAISLAGTATMHLVLDVVYSMLPKDMLHMAKQLQHFLEHGLITSITVDEISENWDHIDKLLSRARWYEQRNKRWDDIDTKLTEVKAQCAHHTKKCKHLNNLVVCHCCNLMMESNPCNCCKTDDCKHSCNHECNGPKSHITNSRTVLCSCCGVTSSNDKCVWCTELETQPEFEYGVNVARQPATDYKQKQPDTESGEDRKLEVSAEDKEVETEKEEVELNTLKMVGIHDIHLLQCWETTPTIAWQKCSPDPRADVGEFRSNLYHIPVGTWEILTSNLNVLTIDNTPNDYGTCGFDALDKADPKSRVHFINLVYKKREWLTDLDFGEIARNYKLNIVVVLKEVSTIYRYDDGDTSYGTILHSKAIDKDTDHWSAAKVEQRGPHVGYCVPDLDCNLYKRSKLLRKLGWTGMLHKGDLPNRQMTIGIELQLSESTIYALNYAKKMQMRLRLYAVDGSQFITNQEKDNATQDIRNGIINFKVRGGTEPLYRLLMNVDESTMEHEDMLSEFTMVNVMEMHEDRIAYNITRENIKMLAMAHLACTGVKQWVKHVINTWQTVELTPITAEMANVKILNEKLKSLDTICIRTTNHGAYHMKVLFKIKGKYNIYWKSTNRDTVKVTVGLTKYSTASAWRTLCAHSAYEVSMADVKRVLSNSLAIIAVPGWGKSTKLVSMMEPQTLAITMTRVACENLKQKGANKGTVMTFEQACMNKPMYTKLLIDEATMIGPVELLTILRKGIEKITCFGDPTQVGVVDMWFSGGTRELSNIVHLCENKERNYESRRIGEPMCGALTELCPGINSIADHQTSLVLHNRHSFDDAGFQSLINQYNINIILTFYQAHKKYLTKYTHGSQISTVHAFQGQERDNVMVVQSNEMVKGGLIHLNKYYCLSAATRAVKLLVWVSVGDGISTGELKDRVELARFTGGKTESWRDMLEKYFTNQAEDARSLLFEIPKMFVKQKLSQIQEEVIKTEDANLTESDLQHLKENTKEEDWQQALNNTFETFNEFIEEESTKRKVKINIQRDGLVTHVTIRKLGVTIMKLTVNEFGTTAVVHKAGFITESQLKEHIDSTTKKWRQQLLSCLKEVLKTEEEETDESIYDNFVWKQPLLNSKINIAQAGSLSDLVQEKLQACLDGLAEKLELQYTMINTESSTLLTMVSKKGGKIHFAMELNDRCQFWNRTNQDVPEVANEVAACFRNMSRIMYEMKETSGISVRTVLYDGISKLAKQRSFNFSLPNIMRLQESMEKCGSKLGYKVMSYHGNKQLLYEFTRGTSDHLYITVNKMGMIRLSTKNPTVEDDIVQLALKLGLSGKLKTPTFITAHEKIDETAIVKEITETISVDKKWLESELIKNKCCQKIFGRIDRESDLFDNRFVVVTKIYKKSSRVITWLCLWHKMQTEMGKQATINIEDGKYRITANAGCAPCSGLKVYEGDQLLLEIEDSYEVLLYKIISINTLIQNVDSKPIVKLIFGNLSMDNATDIRIQQMRNKLASIELLAIMWMDRVKALALNACKLQNVQHFNQVYKQNSVNERKLIVNIMHQTDSEVNLLNWLDQSMKHHTFYNGKLSLWKIGNCTHHVSLIQNKVYIDNCNVDHEGLLKCGSVNQLTSLAMHNWFESRRWTLVQQETDTRDIGADYLVRGMIIPWQEHEAHKTEVWHLVNQRVEKTRMTALKNKLSITFAPISAMKTWESAGLNTIYDWPLVESYTTGSDAGIDCVLESIFLSKLAKGVQLTCINITSYPHLPIINTWLGIKSAAGDSSHSKMLYDINLDAADNSLKALRVNISGDNVKNKEKWAGVEANINKQLEQNKGAVWYKRSHVEGWIVTDESYFNLNCHWSEYSIDTICSLHKQGLTVTGIVPLVLTNATTDMYDTHTTDNNVMLVYKGNNFNYALNKQTLAYSTNGTPILYNGKLYQIVVVDTMPFHAIVELRDVSKAVDVYVVTNVNEIDDTDTWELPILNFNINKGILTENPITMVKVKCNTRMLRALRLRLLKPATSFKDLLQYARTLMHTINYSSTGQWPMYKVKIDNCLAMCAVAWIVHHHTDHLYTLWNDKLKLVTTDVSSKAHQLIEWFFAVTASWYSELIDTLLGGTTIMDILGKLKSLIDEPTTVKIITSLINSFSKMTPSELRQNRVLVEFKEEDVYTGEETQVSTAVTKLGLRSGKSIVHWMVMGTQSDIDFCSRVKNLVDLKNEFYHTIYSPRDLTIVDGDFDNHVLIDISSTNCVDLAKNMHNMAQFVTALKYRKLISKYNKAIKTNLSDGDVIIENSPVVAGHILASKHGLRYGTVDTTMFEENDFTQLAVTSMGREHVDNKQSYKVFEYKLRMLMNLRSKLCSSSHGLITHGHNRLSGMPIFNNMNLKYTKLTRFCGPLLNNDTELKEGLSLYIGSGFRSDRKTLEKLIELTHNVRLDTLILPDKITVSDAEIVNKMRWNKLVLGLSRARSMGVPRTMIHHGGWGISVFCWHNGIGQIVIPMFGDQGMFANMVEETNSGFKIDKQDITNAETVTKIELLQTMNVQPHIIINDNFEVTQWFADIVKGTEIRARTMPQPPNDDDSPNDDEEPNDHDTKSEKEEEKSLDSTSRQVKESKSSVKFTRVHVPVSTSKDWQGLHKGRQKARPKVKFAKTQLLHEMPTIQEVIETVETKVNRNIEVDVAPMELKLYKNIKQVILFDEFYVFQAPHKTLEALGKYVGPPIGSSVLWNPIGIDRCVQDSMRKVVCANSKKWFANMCTTLGIPNLTNLADVYLLANIINLNILICSEDKTIYYRINDSTTYAAFGLQTTNQLRHLNVVEPETGWWIGMTSQGYTKSQVKLQLEVEQCNNEEAVIILGFTKKCNKPHFHVNLKQLTYFMRCLTNCYFDSEFVDILSKMGLSTTVEDLRARLKLTNLQYTLLRSSKPVIKVTTTLHIDGWHVIHSSPEPIHGKMYAVLCAEGWHLAIYLNIGEQKVLWNDLSKSNCMGVLVDIGYKVFDTNRPEARSRIIIGEEDKKTAAALNEITKRKCIELGLATAAMPTKVLPDTTVLVVYHYDNRPHHKYDELDMMLEDNLKILYIGDAPAAWAIKDLVSRESLMRVCYLYGKVSISLEVGAHWASLPIWSSSSVVSTLGKTQISNTVVNIIDVNGSTIMQRAQLESCLKEVFEKEDHNLKPINEPLPVGNHQFENFDQLNDWFESRYIYSTNLQKIKQLLKLEADVEMTVETWSGRPATSDMLERWNIDPVILIGSSMVVSHGPSVCKFTTKGGMENATKLTWWNTESELAQHGMKIFGQPVLKTEGLVLNSKEKVKLGDVEILNELKLEEVETSKMDAPNIGEETTHSRFEFLDSAGQSAIEHMEGLPEEKTSQVIDFWDNNDLSDYNTIYAPLNNITVKSNQYYLKLKTVRKFTYAEYPTHSRPVITGGINQQLNAITGRLGSVQHLRKQPMNNEQELIGIRAAFFRSESQQIISMYKNNPLQINATETIKWLESRKDMDDIKQDLIKLLDEGFSLHELNKVNVHLKKEALLKSTVPEDIRQVKPRIIAWTPKHLAAIYSPVIKEASKRLKNLLKENVLYADGHSVDEIANYLRLRPSQSYFFDDDMQQQDRQTDEQMIDFEFTFYGEVLGVDRNVLRSWRRVHKNWYYKSKTARGNLNAMRLTGQPTTALSNAIVNLCLHWRNYVHQPSGWTMLFQGDDNLGAINVEIDRSLHKHILNTKYNMISKPNLNKFCGQFCGLVVYELPSGNLECGPDWVRMKRRFEVANTDKLLSKLELEQRSQSYTTMIGDNTDTKSICESKNWSLQLMAWYDMASCRTAISRLYKISEFEVEANLTQLYTMIRMDKPITKEFTYMSSN